MKIVPTSKISQNISYSNNNLSMPRQNFNNEAIKGNVSFGSSALNAVSTLAGKATGVFKYIESAGFFMEFLIVDTLSMILPRVWVGLNRDKDKTDNYNIKAGVEEAGREILSGPSMNLIPMGILAIANCLSPAAHMSRDTLESLTQTTVDIIEKSSPQNIGNKAQLNETLARKLFEQFFKSTLPAEEYAKLQDEFVESLTSSTTIKPKSWIKKRVSPKTADAFAQAAAGFEKLIARINNTASTEKAAVDPKALKIGEKGINAAALFEDFHNYSKDILEKLTRKEYVKQTADNCIEMAAEFLKEAKKARVFMKTVTAITAFLAVGEFLLHLPKIYQVSKISPAQESAKRAINEVAKQGGTNENS